MEASRPVPSRRRNVAAIVIAALGALVLAGFILWWILAEDDEVLVVTDPQQRIFDEFDAGDTVRVTGTVRAFDFTAFDGIGDAGDFDDFDGEPVIIAESVEDAAGGDEEENGDVFDRLADEDASLIGEQVTVTGELAGATGISSFVLEDD